MTHPIAPVESTLGALAAALAASARMTAAAPVNLYMFEKTCLCCGGALARASAGRPGGLSARAKTGEGPGSSGRWLEQTMKVLMRASHALFVCGLVLGSGCGDDGREETTGAFTTAVTTTTTTTATTPGTSTVDPSAGTTDPSGSDTEASAGMTTAGTTMGVTSGPSCDDPMLQCGDDCVDPQSDPLHCGACDTVCADDEVCTNGICSLDCAVGFEECDGACVDLNSDVMHCGACDTVCDEGYLCIDGACSLDCEDGFVNCNGVCVDLQIDPNNCGECDTVCGDGEMCEAGLCESICADTELFCDNTCIDPQSDPANCGDCGIACADDEQCANGVCEAICAMGELYCNDVCIDPLTDDANCGQCGQVCGNNELCIDGMCEATTCGNNVVDQGEHCDIGLGDPYVGVGCQEGSCLYDFSGVSQLYCNGTCTWDAPNGCDQADANIFCKLLTGNPQSTATNWVNTTALAEPGFACNFFNDINLGPLPEFGVNVNVIYQETSILANHGAGAVITNPTCTNP